MVKRSPTQLIFRNIEGGENIMMRDYKMERKLGYIEGVNATIMALVEDFTNPSSHLSRDDEDNNREIEEMGRYLADKLLGSGALDDKKVEKLVALNISHDCKIKEKGYCKCQLDEF
jgi:hypothetical protein